jgi:anaerobic selenocysteine-containing dehydrogenase
MADYHLRVKPGTDAWCISAMIATIIQEGLQNDDFIKNHTEGYAQVKPISKISLFRNMQKFARSMKTSFARPRGVLQRRRQPPSLKT